MAVDLFRDRSLTVGQKVKVYRNLNNGRISIMDYKSGLVVAHSNFITLYDVMFLIRTSGQMAARESGVRNVHAFAVGYFAHSEKQRPSNWDEFTYNPFKNDTFVNRSTGLPVRSASNVYLQIDKYFYLE